MVILTTFSLVLILLSLTNILSKYLKIDNFEKPIFSIGIIIVILNFFYFNFGLSIKLIFNLILLLSVLSILYTLINFKNYKKDIIKILYVTLPILILFELINIFYGQQFYVFRGNQQDAFVYASVGLSFFNYTHQELINLKINNSEIINDHYLNHALNLIYYRPSVGLIIGFLKNIPKSDIIFISLIFKIICTVITLFSILSFFNYFKIKFKTNIFLSYIFILSFFYFYNFEIDAYSLILSMPFFILIVKYSLSIGEKLQKFNLNLVKYIFLWSCFFIIYPNGAAIIMPPVAILVIFALLKNNFKLNIIKNIFISIIIFTLIVFPTYKTTVLYLYQEMMVGLFHGPDYWGYYGAFILGKDNPIRDILVVDQVKSMLAENNSFLHLLKEILSLNFENNSNYFFLNIIPSIFGYFHFTTNKLSSFNTLFIIILIFLNISILKRISLNLLKLFSKKDDFSMLIKCFFLYFIIFFLILIFSGNIWSSIKLFFVLSPIFFFLIIFDFSKKNLKPKITILSILLVFLPFYKYSSFNYGIGKIDSFPSIIHVSNKQNTKWYIDREKLYKCKNLIYDIENKYEKIFISMIFNDQKKIIHKNTMCRLSKEKNKFKLEKI
jgi:hypothetical protein